jgi:uncharacterized protein (TIGR00255 family)
MKIRSMTGFAQVRGQIGAQLGFTLSLKSVNHRFLDIHFRTPGNCDALEMKLRRALKENLGRGHVEFTLSLERTAGESLAFNREVVGGYIQAFRMAAAEFGLAAEPDLNVILRTPGALDATAATNNGELDAAVLAKVADLIRKLNEMREDEGGSAERELRERMAKLREATKSVESHRQAVLQSYLEKLKSRMQELIGAEPGSERLMQEAALLVDRSDIQEELVRLDAHINHFLDLLDQGGEIGKKLDFLLQEMNREANTLLSKTSGLAGGALNITETGLGMKSEIEKAREQVQNIE